VTASRGLFGRRRAGFDPVSASLSVLILHLVQPDCVFEVTTEARIDRRIAGRRARSGQGADRSRSVSIEAVGRRGPLIGFDLSAVE